MEKHICNLSGYIVSIFTVTFLLPECNCNGHTRECHYDEEVAANRQSLDIHGNYDGGGVCDNCQHFTTGINCEQCVPGYYRPYGVLPNDTYACQSEYATSFDKKFTHLSKILLQELLPLGYSFCKDLQFLMKWIIFSTQPRRLVTHDRISS